MMTQRTKVFAALATVFISTGVVFFITIGRDRGDAAKGVVKSPPPDKKNKKNQDCPGGDGRITVIDSEVDSDEGQEIDIESTDENVCAQDTVCGVITGPPTNRKFKIRKKCK